MQEMKSMKPAGMAPAAYSMANVQGQKGYGAGSAQDPVMKGHSIWWSMLQVITLPLFFPSHIFTEDTWRNCVSVLLLVVFQFISFPLMLFGHLLEWFLNFYSVNGGTFFKVVSKLVLEWRLDFPNPRSSKYRSVIGLIDPRYELTNQRSDRFYKWNSKECAELSIMAAKLAYESEAVQKEVVEGKWDMCFHGFYDCYNARVAVKTTQAFIFKDKRKDTKLVVLAFRGTEPFNAQDWSTDFDFGWYQTLHDVGKVHVGFLEALGVQNRMNPDRFEQRPKNRWSDSFAYPKISEELSHILQDNPDAQLIITGHGLGGALAVIFAGMMIYLDGAADKASQKVLQSLKAVYTFGQPRVGNEKFAQYLTRSLERHGIEYHRVVYGYDMVPRVPFDDKIFGFHHAGHMCNYYDASYVEQGLRVEPNSNFFDFIFFFASRFTAVMELCNGLVFNRLLEGDWYKENKLMIIARISGLFMPGLTGHAPNNYVNAVRMGPDDLSTQVTY